ncbi:MAG: cupredoxin domain-containing protein [Candidatus Micrarchaeota archaeon]|nr:cupredoxin domain-containing protein [Candidatus Micrarchaeota archaeon]
MASLTKPIIGGIIVVIIIAAVALAYRGGMGSPYGSGTTTSVQSGGPVTSFKVQLSNAQGQFVITPNVISVTAGGRVSLNITNAGTMVHSFVIPDLSVSAPSLSPGQSYTLNFTAPATAGNYTYYCPVDSHKSLGMVGTLVVTTG